MPRKTLDEKLRALSASSLSAVAHELLEFAAQHVSGEGGDFLYDLGNEALDLARAKKRESSWSPSRAELRNERRDFERAFR